MIILEVQETAARRGRFDGWVDNRQVVASSRTPFLTAARALLKDGADPAEILLMRHRRTGTDSLRGPIGKAALLAVRETNSGPKFVQFASMAGWGQGDDENEKIEDPLHAHASL
jgi:hypothetical protein